MKRSSFFVDCNIFRWISIFSSPLKCDPFNKFGFLLNVSPDEFLPLQSVVYSFNQDCWFLRLYIPSYCL